MAKLIVGLLLLSAGLITISADLPIIWTGAITGGPLLILLGAMELLWKGKPDDQAALIQHNWEDLLKRLQAEEPIDEIAAEYYRSNDIPPMRTIQAAAYLIKNLAESEDESSQFLAAHLTSTQVVAFYIDSKEAIESFSFVDQVYCVDDTVTMFTEEPPSRSGTPGTLVLNKGFLFFFEKPRILVDKFAGERAIGRLGDAFPVLSIAIPGYSIVSGLSRELQDYFSDSRKEVLKERFALDKSVALPLVQLVGVGPWQRRAELLTSPYLVVAGHTKQEHWTYWFETTSVDEEEWAGDWAERLQLACIAEGELLV